MTNAGINARSSRDILKEFGKFKDVVTVAPIEKRQVKYGSWAENLGKLVSDYKSYAR